MIYLWTGVAIVMLFLGVRLMKWINGPKIEEEKTERFNKWMDFRKWRRENGGLLGWRKRRPKLP